jgi:kynurenine formamidase
MKLILVAVLILSSTRLLGAGGEPSLWSIQRTLVSKKYVDLTHEFAPGIPHWPGFPDETRKTIYWYDKRPDTLGSGFCSELFTHIGQCGTHVDPPAHLVKGLCTVDQIEHSLETYILSTNHYQIELLTNLDQVPEAGANIVVSFPKPKNGSGFPARVFAIVP